jgi:hypothetical protein
MISNVIILLLTILLIAYSGLNLYAAVRADELIFPAPPASYHDDESILKLDASDGEKISAYYLGVEKAEKLLLYSHGNGEDIGQLRDFLKIFQRQGISVLTYDYPGYGTSTGKPTEAGCYTAIEAAYKYGTETLGYTPNQIVLYGRSLGGGPSTWLAEKSQVDAIILDGTFTSTFRVMTGVKLLPWDRFDNYVRLPNIKEPILLLHGTADRTVPFSHAQRNWKAIKGPKYSLFVNRAGHNDLIEVAGREYWEMVMPFIKGDLR